uniref:Uncharacterized protein n=1 Tax=Panagrolaimus sp. JU765 TaxID=591449 RepID=A0AC34QHW7_9BILA
MGTQFDELADPVYISNESVINDEYPPAKFAKRDEGLKKVIKPKRQKVFYPRVAREYYDHLSSADLLPEESINYFSKKLHVDTDEENVVVEPVDDLVEPLPYMEFDLDRNTNECGIANHWENNWHVYSDDNGGKSKLIMESDDFDVLKKKLSTIWSFQEDFILIMCEQFYHDIEFALNAIDKRGDELADRLKLLRTKNSYGFFAKFNQLSKGEYLRLIRSMPLHPNDLNVIRSLPRNRILNNAEFVETRKKLLLPMDKEMILSIWKSMRDNKELKAQVREKSNFRRITRYVLDDVEKGGSHDFTKNHRYVYNAIPGENSAALKLSNNPFYQTFSISNAVCTVLFPNSKDVLPLREERTLLNYVGLFETIPLQKKNGVYYPSTDFHYAVLIFWKQKDLFVLNLCGNPIMVGLSFLESRQFTKISTKYGTPIQLRPTLDDPAEFCLVPNKYYFATGRNPEHLPKLGHWQMTFGADPLPLPDFIDISTGFLTRSYQGVVDRQKELNLPRLNDDDFGFYTYTKDKFVKESERMKYRRRNNPTEEEIIENLLYELVDKVDMESQGIRRKKKICGRLFPSKTQLVKVDEHPSGQLPVVPPTKETRAHLALGTVRIQNISDNRETNIIYSMMQAHSLQKKTLKEEIAKFASKYDGVEYKPPIDVMAPLVKQMPAKPKAKPKSQSQPRPYRIIEVPAPPPQQPLFTPRMVYPQPVQFVYNYTPNTYQENQIQPGVQYFVPVSQEQQYVPVQVDTQQQMEVQAVNPEELQMMEVDEFGQYYYPDMSYE